LKKVVRLSDIFARVGGEGLGILASRLSLEEGFEYAEKIRKLIAQNPLKISAEKLYVSASFSVSIPQGDEVQQTWKYFSLADKALHLAVARGKTGLRYWDKVRAGDIDEAKVRYPMVEKGILW
jgi:diguanylate cyclase (GGDEF)-like protein